MFCQDKTTERKSLQRPPLLFLSDFRFQYFSRWPGGKPCIHSAAGQAARTKAIIYMEEKKTPETVETAAAAAPAEKKTAAKKTAAKTTTKKTVRKTAAKKTAPKAEDTVLETIEAEAADGVKIQEEIASEAKAVKKAPARKTTKKAAAKAEEPAKAEEAKPAVPQTEAMVQEEAAKGAEVLKAEDAEKKPARKTTRKTAAKTETAAKKPAAKKTTKAKTTKKAAAAEKAPEPKAAEAPAKPAKSEEKPAEAKTSVIVRPEARPAVKKEMPLTDAKVEKEAAAKAEAAKTPAKAEVKAEEKAAPAKEAKAEKAPVKEEKAVSRPLVELTDEKLNFYNTLSNDVLNDAAKALVDMDWNALAAGLQNAEDIPSYIQKVLADNRERAAAYDFEKDGFDASVLPVFAERIAETLPFKASDNASLADRINELLTYQISDDALANADAYHRMMDVMREVLMMGQRENITSLEQINGQVNADLFGLLYKFMDLAYATLPTWQYNDVKYYEGFLYGFLSQFTDLNNMHNRAMMDVADLYIKHGDYGKGDAEYNYVLRENDVKDQIYFRFADVYRPIDFQKAKSIAGSALQYVDGRYDYYNRIMEILNS